MDKKRKQGRPSKFGEPSVSIGVKVPKSKRDEALKMIKRLVDQTYTKTK